MSPIGTNQTAVNFTVRFFKSLSSPPVFEAQVAATFRPRATIEPHPSYQFQATIGSGIILDPGSYWISIVETDVETAKNFTWLFTGANGSGSFAVRAGDAGSWIQLSGSQSDFVLALEGDANPPAVFFAQMPRDVDYGQHFRSNLFVGPGTAEFPYQVADEFTLSSRVQLRRVAWEGFYFFVPIPSDRSTVAFTIRVHLDLNAAPVFETEVQASYTRIATINTDPVSAMYRWSGDLGLGVTLQAGQRYWISILESDPNTERDFAWLNTYREDAPEFAWREGPTVSWNSTLGLPNWPRNDFTLELAGDLLPPEIPDEVSLTLLQPPYLSSGQDHNCGVRTDGTVVCWGSNSFGQVNVPVGLTSVSQVALGHSHSCALRQDGTVACWGLNNHGQASPPAGLTNVARIGTGDAHTCAVSASGAATCWGSNGDGQATVPTDLGAVLQIVGGNTHSCALRWNKTVRCWGNNGNGQADVPVGLSFVEEVTAGALHTCARKIDGSVQCWGWNFSGQSTPPAGLNAVQIGAGEIHTCAVTVARTVTCWGNAWADVPAGLSGVVQVDAGSKHTCARRSDHMLSCWGSNALGQTTLPVSTLAPLLPQVIVFTSTPPSFGRIGMTYVVSATGGGSANPIVFSLHSPPNVCAISGNVVLLLGSGFCEIVASQNGGDGYAPGFAVQTFEIIAGATGTGSLVNVAPVDGITGGPTPVSMVFNTVTQPGVTTVTTVPAEGTESAPPPAGFQLGNPPVYYEIETTATFTGVVQVCIRYEDSHFTNESTLRLLHWNGDRWEDITTSHNTAANAICGLTTSFSPFALGQNVPPQITRTLLPLAPAPLGSIAEALAQFTDPTLSDVHSASFGWGDGTSSNATVTPPGPNTAGVFAATHTFTQPGVYTITATVNDGVSSASRSSAADDPAYIVVYDPNGGFVTGGGWVDSPTTACPVLCQGANGKANFGFVAKYVRGANQPAGHTEFQFRAGGLNFASESYQWLVVSGMRAQFKGIGTINGGGTYGFLITAIDGALDPLNQTDRFRIKLWDISAGGTIVYDNQMGNVDEADPTTAIGGGSIIIKK